MKLNLKLIQIFIIVILSSQSYAIDCNIKCNEHLTLGSPIDKRNQIDQCLCYPNMAIGYSYKNKTPIWSSFYLTHENLKDINNSKYSYSQIRKRNCKFEDDEKILLNIYKSYKKDYAKSGYQLGHLSSARSLTHSNLEESMANSCLMSNIFPQNGINNIGAWKSLEIKEREFVKNNDHAFIINGIHFENNNKTIKNNIRIPSYIYKIVLSLDTRNSFAYYIPNIELRKKDLEDYKIEINEIEEKTGFDFNPLLPDVIENTIEENI